MSLETHIIYFISFLRRMNFEWIWTINGWCIIISFYDEWMNGLVEMNMTQNVIEMDFTAADWIFFFQSISIAIVTFNLFGKKFYRDLKIFAERIHLLYERRPNFKPKKIVSVPSVPTKIEFLIRIILNVKPFIVTYTWNGNYWNEQTSAFDYLQISVAGSSFGCLNLQIVRVPHCRRIRKCTQIYWVQFQVYATLTLYSTVSYFLKRHFIEEEEKT